MTVTSEARTTDTEEPAALRPNLLAPLADADDLVDEDAAEDERPYLCNDCDGFGCSFCRDGGEDL